MSNQPQQSQGSSHHPSWSMKQSIQRQAQKSGACLWSLKDHHRQSPKPWRGQLSSFLLRHNLHFHLLRLRNHSRASSALSMVSFSSIRFLVSL